MLRASLIGMPATIGLVALLFVGGLLAPLQRLIEEQRFGLLSRPPTGGIVLLDIDEPSIQALGNWPWSRSRHAAVVDRLHALDAADIAFDIDFSSPSTPDGDAAFEAALKRAGGSVVLAAVQQPLPGAIDTHAQIASRPLARFAAHAWEASVDVRPDSDGRVREVLWAERFGPEQLPSLSALLGGGSGPVDGFFGIDFGIDARHLPHISVVDLLEGRVERELIAGKSVIVGASALQLRDYFQVPRFGAMAGSAVQALAADSLRQGRALRPTSLALTLAVTSGLLGFLAALGRRLTLGNVLSLCLGAGAVVEATAFVVQWRWPVIPVTAPIHVGLAGFALLAVSIEVVERRIRLQRARRHASRLRAILSRVVADSFAGVVVVDRDGVVQALSEATTTILPGVSDADIGRRFDAVLPLPLVQLLADAIAAIRRGAAGPRQTDELRLAMPDGRDVTLDCVTTVSERIEGGNAAEADFVVCLTFLDVTDKRNAQRRIAEMARVDSLTSLANRHVFLARVEEVRRPVAHSAVLLFDIDRFKLVNDRFGHGAGDALLKAVADRLGAMIAPGDLAARLGGDEFAVILRRGSRDDVQGFADQLVAGLSGPYDIGRYQTMISVSAGFAFAEGQEASDIVAGADAALYAAKASGGAGARLYDAAMRADIEDSRHLERDLRDAVDRNEIQVVYQRQVDVRSGRIVGVEALARWRHPERGSVSPATFIPLAERTGLITRIGACVLARACQDAAGWPVPIKVSVNLSALQLASPTLADTVLDALAVSGLEPRRLDVELTESLLMENDDLVRATLNRLRGAGVSVSLDDFGTGYSSLAYMRTFPIDKVKIDQSFVRDLVADVSCASIIRAVVGLSRDLGLRVNAEGVESEAQMQALRRLGCDEVQGYLHGRPDSSAIIAESLAAEARATYEARRA